MKSYSQFTIIAYILGPVLIVASHFGCLLVLMTGLSWGASLWAIALYLLRMLGTTAIYHRLLTHKSYQTPKLILWLGCLITTSSGQMGPSWWKAHHLAHHRHADQPQDPHSPLLPGGGLKGFWRSQAGWLLVPSFFPAQLPPDVENDRVLQAIDRLHFVPTLALGALSYQLGGLQYLAAFFLSTTVLFHGVATVNSLSHLFGDRPFKTEDYSRNNRLVAVLTLGEGWHNFHHAFQSSARHGITLKAGRVVYLPDPTFGFIKMLEFCNLATKLRLPRETELLAKGRQPSEVIHYAHPID